MRYGATQVIVVSSHRDHERRPLQVNAASELVESNVKGLHVHVQAVMPQIMRWKDSCFGMAIVGVMRLQQVVISFAQKQQQLTSIGSHANDAGTLPVS